MRSILSVLAVALAALLLSAAPAAAAREATTGEIVGMGDKPGVIEHVCADGWVSEIDPAWGALVANTYDGCDERIKVVFHRGADGRWTRVGSGSAGDACVDSLTEVPEEVARELTGCTRSTLRRAATDEERAAAAAALWGGVAAECLTLRIALKDERFGVATLPDSDACGDGAVIVSRADGGWKVVSDLMEGRTLCRTPGVPEAVMRDLHRACIVPRPAAMVCGAGTRSIRRVRPSSCMTTGGGYAQSRWLIEIRWSAWGGERAVGRGFSRHFRARANDRHLPVRIEAFGRSQNVCGYGRPFYTRVKIIYRASRMTVGGTAFRIPAGSTTVRLGRPDSC